MEISLVDQIEQVYIDDGSWDTPVALRARQMFAKDKILRVFEKPHKDLSGALSAKQFGQSKRELYLTEFKGAFFKRCPGATPGLSCCNYFVLNLGQQCNMNCSYCYLQSYLNYPALVIYTNIDRALIELKEMADSYPDRFYRVGTGEITDSLGMDDLTLYSNDLIDFFSKYPSWTLEFKTKSSKVDQFLHKKAPPNVIVSWSINPQEVIENEEHGTADLKNRLAAAKKCVQHGYKVAFHIDPMIWHKDWKVNYEGLVENIVTLFEPDDVKWITVGALRFQPEQRAIMRERFGLKSWVTSAEVFPSREGRLRYDAELRNTMFQTVVGRFRDASPHWKVTLCMETKESWVTTMASSPRKMPELEKLFEPLPQKPLNRKELQNLL